MPVGDRLAYLPRNLLRRTTRASPRSSCRSAQRAQSREVELAFVRHRRPRLVPGAPFTRYIKVAFFAARRCDQSRPAPARQPTGATSTSTKATSSTRRRWRIRLDRLARSTRDILNLLGTIAERGAGFKSLRDTWADTTTAHGRLMLTILGGLAEFERELIRTRTGEGRERAKARGVILGRKPKLTGHQRREAIARREAGEVLTDIARSYNVSHSTISRLS